MPGRRVIQTAALCAVAFGLTGYLLPWDNRAYWGTVVTTQIAGLAPGAGPYVQQLLGAGANGIGAIGHDQTGTDDVGADAVAPVLPCGGPREGDHRRL